jgi:hypothetical protein
VYVVAAAGAVIVRVAVVPPSHHVSNVYVSAPIVWGDGALMLFAEPTITVREKGVASEVGPTVRSRPAGVEANDRSTVFGWNSREAVLVTPWLSVTDATSSMCDGYSWSG